MNKCKITFIGGGSSKFIREVVVDLFSYPVLQESHIELMDIDAERVQRSEKIVRKIVQDLNLPATISATTDRRRAIEGSDYLIITFMVGGFTAYHSDVAIPLKYGVSQTVSDTTGPGGVFRTIRTTPELSKIAADLLQLAPEAWVLNCANPMSMNILALTFQTSRAVWLRLKPNWLVPFRLTTNGVWNMVPRLFRHWKEARSNLSMVMFLTTA
jgi:alpha-galactosidase